MLRDYTRPGRLPVPPIPKLDELRKTLAEGTIFLAPCTARDELAILAVRREAAPTIVRARASASDVVEQFRSFQQTLKSLIDRYRLGAKMLALERAAVDEKLETLGRGPLGQIIVEALDRLGGRGGGRIIWAVDQTWDGLPVHALRIEDRYLVESHEIVSTFGGSFLVHHGCRRRPGWRRRRDVVIAGAAPKSVHSDLTFEEEAQGVQAALRRAERLLGGNATRAAVRERLARARVAHFACHVAFESEHPLAAALELPSGEQITAVEWLDEPINDLPLLVHPNCDSGRTSGWVGSEGFGLAAACLAAGARAILAGLWKVGDREAVAVMWSFYRYLMAHDPAAALAEAQRDAIRRGESPLHWAAFSLFGDPAALGRPAWWRRLLAPMFQRRHLRAYAFPRPRSDAA
jgi:CHAT domain-containing protein